MQNQLGKWKSMKSGRLLLAASFFAALLPISDVAVSQTAPPAEVAQEPAYQVDISWPQRLPGKWLIGDVASVSVDRHNHVWIIHRPAGLAAADILASNTPPTAKCCIPAPSVLEFDTEGKLLRSWGGADHVPDWFDSEHGIFVDNEDNVWLLGAGAHDGQLMKFTADGKLLLRIGRKGEFPAADDTTMLGMPSDMYVDTDRQEVFVSDGYRNHRVIVFDSNTGAFKRQWTAFGKKVDPAYFSGGEETGSNGLRNELELFTTVHCITMIGGEVHVCDRTNSRIQVFSPDGTYLREIFFNRELGGGGGTTWGASPVPGHPDLIMVLDGTNSEFAMLNRFTGEIVNSYMNKGHFAGQMHWPHNVAMDRQGRAYVAEVNKAGRVQRFVPISKPTP